MVFEPVYHLSREVLILGPITLELRSIASIIPEDNVLRISFYKNRGELKVRLTKKAEEVLREVHELIDRGESVDISKYVHSIL